MRLSSLGAERQRRAHKVDHAQFRNEGGKVPGNMAGIHTVHQGKDSPAQAGVGEGGGDQLQGERASLDEEENTSQRAKRAASKASSKQSEQQAKRAASEASSKRKRARKHN